MKTWHHSLLVVTGLAALLLAGCSTPETRIRENPQLFASLPADQQDMIRHGRVGVGFTAEMVRLALGEPDRLTVRTDAQGSSEEWHYITYENTGGAMLYRGWYHRYYMWHDPFYPWYMDYPERRERDRFTVVFRAGHVVAMERESGDGR